MTEKKTPSRMLLLISTPKFAETAVDLLGECGVPITSGGSEPLPAK